MLICDLRNIYMYFKKDILLIDTEFSGFDLKKHDLLQVAAILLDKKTLKEKKVFSTYIRPRHWKTRMRDAMEVNKITYDMVKDAPTLAEAIREFDQTFQPEAVIQAFYVGYNDKRWLLHAYEHAKVPWRFDYHCFELWGLFYPWLAASNKLKSTKDFAGFGLESLMRQFDIKPLGQEHDALVDCRIEAEILRRVMKKLN